MAKKKSFAMGFDSLLDDLMAVPRSFMFGWLAGIVVPLASLAGVISGIYLLTKKIPFVTEVLEQEGDRRLVVKLVEPEEARTLLQRSREAAREFRDEIRAEVENEA